MEVLVDLKYVKDEYRIKLARTTTDEKLLDCLAEDDNELVREGVARNRYTSQITLHELSLDKHYSNIRWAVAENPKTASKTLDNLSEDKEAKVRFSAVKNPNTSTDTLRNRSKVVDCWWIENAIEEALEKRKD